jgi:hypothetical protein
VKVLITRLQTIDRRIIFLLLFIVVGYPLVRPIGLPLPITPWVRNIHNLISGLKAGDVMVVSCDFGASMEADIYPSLVVVFGDLMKKGVRVIGVSFQAEGTRYLGRVIGEWEKKGKQYGVDFIDVGYIAGYEAACSAFAGDFVKTAPTDSRGNPTGSLPIMQGRASLSDCQAYMGFTSSSQLGGPEYVRQLGNYGVPILVGCVTVSVTEYEPYVQSGQMAGLIGGLKGAAEYEALSDQPGAGLAGMDAQSAGHMLIIIFVALCNIGYFVGRKSGKAGGA